MILHLLKTGLSQTWHDPLLTEPTTRRKLSKTHHQVTLARTRVWHSLRNHHFPLYFPRDRKIHPFRPQRLADPAAAALPHPGAITAVACGDFVAQDWSPIGRNVHKAALLADIYAAAQRSIALPVALDSSAIAMFRLVLEQYLALGRLRDNIAQQAEAALADNPDRRRLMTVPESARLSR